MRCRQPSVTRLLAWTGWRSMLKAHQVGQETSHNREYVSLASLGKTWSNPSLTACTIGYGAGITGYVALHYIYVTGNRDTERPNEHVCGWHSHHDEHGRTSWEVEPDTGACHTLPDH